MLQTRRSRTCAPPQVRRRLSCTRHYPIRLPYLITGAPDRRRALQLPLVAPARRPRPRGRPGRLMRAAAHSPGCPAPARRARAAHVQRAWGARARACAPAWARPPTGPPAAACWQRYVRAAPPRMHWAPRRRRAPRARRGRGRACRCGRPRRASRGAPRPARPGSRVLCKGAMHVLRNRLPPAARLPLGYRSAEHCALGCVRSAGRPVRSGKALACSTSESLSGDLQAEQ